MDESLSPAKRNSEGVLYIADGSELQHQQFFGLSVMEKLYQDTFPLHIHGKGVWKIPLALPSEKLTFGNVSANLHSGDWCW